MFLILIIKVYLDLLKLIENFLLILLIVEKFY